MLTWNSSQSVYGYRSNGKVALLFRVTYIRKKTRFPSHRPFILSYEIQTKMIFSFTHSYTLKSFPFNQSYILAVSQTDPQTGKRHPEDLKDSRTKATYTKKKDEPRSPIPTARPI